jgi:hypothetical protein
MVAEIWNREEKCMTCIDRWQNKIRYLRKYLRGWAKHTNGTYKKETEELTEKIEQLDKKKSKAQCYCHMKWT